MQTRRYPTARLALHCARTLWWVRCARLNCSGKGALVCRSGERAGAGQATHQSPWQANAARREETTEDGRGRAGLWQNERLPAGSGQRPGAWMDKQFHNQVACSSQAATRKHGDAVIGTMWQCTVPTPISAMRLALRASAACLRWPRAHVQDARQIDHCPGKWWPAVEIPGWAGSCRSGGEQACVVSPRYASGQAAVGERPCAQLRLQYREIDQLLGHVPG